MNYKLLNILNILFFRNNFLFAFVLLCFQASDAWGIECLRYEIRDIRMPARVQEAMQMQVSYLYATVKRYK